MQIGDNINFSGDMIDLFTSLTAAKESTETFVKVTETKQDMDKSLFKMVNRDTGDGTVDTYA